MRVALPRMACRIAIVILLSLAVHWVIDAAMYMSEALPPEDQPAAYLALMTGSVVLYALLIMVPFVPGIEIGVALLMLRGADIAPVIYLATVIGLFLAYHVGRNMPIATLRRLFLDLRLVGACRLLDQIGPLSPQERLIVLHASLPAWAGMLATKFRYLALALLINIPGNVVIGGGGGILMVAGLSGVFTSRAVFITLAVAVAPVPLAVWGFGLDLL